jgi:uncharacterized protein (TIGR03435 family)
MRGATTILLMRKIVTRLLIGIVAAYIFPHSRSAIAQTQPEGERPQRTQVAFPAFEVASVRPSNPNQREVGGFYTYPGGRIVGKGCTLKYLIMIAFNVQDFQISGGPGWIADAGGERFDIQAKPPDDSLSAQWKTNSPKTYPGPEEREMLQSLLADRFRLAVHRETKEGPVYILSKGPSDLKLTPPKDTNEFPWAGGIGAGLPGGDGIRGMNISMAEFAARLSQWLGRPVTDKTGVEGSFDFEFHSGDADPNSSTDITDSILRSIRGIGLNLKPSKGPIQAIVVDHVEQPLPN